MQNAFKDLTTQNITKLVEARVEMVKAIQVEIDDLTHELELRQDTDRPVQLELF